MPVPFWIICVVVCVISFGYLLFHICNEIIRYEYFKYDAPTNNSPLFWRIVEFIFVLTLVFPVVVLMLALWQGPAGARRYWKYGPLYGERRAMSMFRLIQIRESHNELQMPVTI